MDQKANILSTEQFQQMKQCYTSLCQNMHIENSRKLSTEDIQKMRAHMSASKLKKQLEDYSTYGKLYGYAINNVKHQQDNASLVMLVALINTQDLPVIITCLIPSTGDKDTDSANNQGNNLSDVEYKECTWYMCVSKGTEIKNCIESIRLVEKNKDCGETNEGCPNTPCNSASGDKPDTSGSIDLDPFIY